MVKYTFCVISQGLIQKSILNILNDIFREYVLKYGDFIKRVISQIFLFEKSINIVHV